MKKEGIMPRDAEFQRAVQEAIAQRKKEMQEEREQINPHLLDDERGFDGFMDAVEAEIAKKSEE
jgi:hypothetical protein